MICRLVSRRQALVASCTGAAQAEAEPAGSRRAGGIGRMNVWGIAVRTASNGQNVPTYPTDQAQDCAARHGVPGSLPDACRILPCYTLISLI